jgi:transposase
LAPVRPRDLVGKTRRRLAAHLIIELATIDKRIKATDIELRELITTTGSGLLESFGIGPSSAARLLGDIAQRLWPTFRDRVGPSRRVVADFLIISL